jgi:site-specific DNA recombinase
MKPTSKNIPADRNGHAPVIAALYARVSTEEQRERQSIETQIDFARSWCTRENIPLVDIYRDEGISGTVPFEDRPGGKRLLADARQKKFTAVLVYKVDRLGRADVVSHVALHHLETLGIGLRSLTEPFDTATPQGRFMFSILVANSTMERENIRERSIAGTHRVVKEGKWPGGSPPYGYTIGADGRLEINEEAIPEVNLSEAEVIRRVFRWVTEERISLLSIAARLNELGIPPPSRSTGRERKRKQGSYLFGVWHTATVSCLLHRSTYKGEHVYGRLSKKASRELIPQSVPAIVSSALWGQAQDALRKNLCFAKRNGKRDYLLRGILRCSVCGRRYQGTPSNGQPYYTCRSMMTYNRILLNTQCPSRRLRAEWIEGLVWNELQSWVLNQQDLETVMTEALREQEQKRQEWAASLARMKRDLGQMDTQRSRVLTLYRKGVLSDAELEQQLAELKSEHGHFQHVAQEMETRLSFTVDLDSAVISVRNQLEAFHTALRKKTVPFALKRKIVETFVAEVRVSLEQRSPLTVTLKETIPWRPEQHEPVHEGERITLWQREGTQPLTPERTGTVEIRYCFPFPPQPKTLASITSITPTNLCKSKGKH